MPFYDYHCEANNKTIEVFHKMDVKLKTWGEVCELTGEKLGKTDPKTPVIRLIAGEPQTFKLKGLDKDAPSSKLDL